MSPVPANVDRMLKWLEKQIVPSLFMIDGIGKATCIIYMKDMDGQSVLTAKHEMLIRQICMDIAEVIERDGDIVMIFLYGKIRYFY